MRTANTKLPPGTKLLERLAQEAVITPEDVQRAILHAQRIDGRCEDAIIETGAISEQDLLTYIANVYRTRFVTTPKLAKASIGRDVLSMVPRKVAERLMVCPILYEADKHALSVVAGDLGEHDVAKQVQLVSSVREVRVYVALPATVQALVRKHYDGDRDAFNELASRSPAVARSLGGQGGTVAGAEYYDDRAPGSGGNPELTKLESSAGDLPLAPAARAALAARDSKDPGPYLGTPPTGIERKRQPIRIEAPEVPQAKPTPSQPVTRTEMRTEIRVAEEQPAAPPVISANDYVATLNVLVALHEQGRGELRGHSAQVARLVARICERMGLDDARKLGVMVSAYVHDIGKGSSYHLTALNVAQYEGHKIQAQKTYLTPLRYFESVKLPQTTTQAITHMYERPDGSGFPDQLGGKEIPIGARILAVAETYCDITSNPKNPFRKVLDPKEACAALARHRDQIFDGTVVDLMKMLVLGDDLKAKLLSDRPTVLLCDPDPEETTVLELRLVENGFEVVIARSALDAYERAQKGGIDAIVSEVDITPIDGFELLMRLRQGGAATEVPVLFLTRRSDRDSVDRGFELGASDFLVKPASGEVVAAKARQVLAAAQRRGGGRGVSGSLTEMALPDVLQVLSNGRKSGKLEVASAGKKGEILFSDGAIWDAKFGPQRGHEAIYAMLILTTGEFVLDPQARPTDRSIHESTESLLLEGMRRLDEGRR